MYVYIFQYQNREVAYKVKYFRVMPIAITSIDNH